MTEQQPAMIPKLVWALVTAGALLACLGLGLAIGQMIAPTPTVGVVRFDEVIDFETATRFNQLIENAANDDQIVAVTLEIASPGGYATSSENIFYTLLKLRQAKPLVVVIDGLAASGGYYMAAAANQIFAPASSYVGNVGTRGGRPMDPMIFPDELTSGPYKLSGGSRFDQIRQLDLVARSFISNVVQQRSAAHITPLSIRADEVAEARIYLGNEALAIGLIDAEGSRADAIAAAAQLAGLPDYAVDNLEQRYGIDISPNDAASPLTERIQRMVHSAPPGAVFMLDDRIPLPGLVQRNTLADHLQELRSRASLPGGWNGVWR